MELRCLIVDDNAQFCETAADLLRRDGIDVVGSASTIAETLAIARDLRPDVYLVDIDLGEESGFEVARQLVIVPELRHAPVILMSSYAEADFAEVIASSPASGFLPKPHLSGAALRQAVSAAAGRDGKARDQRAGPH